MSKVIHYSREMKECPYCGHDEFYVKQSYHGVCEYNFRYDGKEAENGDMWEGATMKDITKYAYCNNCNKRLFLMKEFYENMY